MKHLIAFLIASVLLINCIVTEELNYNAFVQDADYVQALNSHPSSTWNAALYPQFRLKTVNNIKKRLGNVLDVKSIGKKYKITSLKREQIKSLALPENYDFNRAWTTCSLPVQDEGQCGSNWAMTAVSVMSNRLCVQSGNSTQLSTQYVLECDSKDFGCSGGFLNTAWEFLEETGTVDEQCDPYSAGSGTVGPCPTTCKNGSPIRKKYKVKNTRTLKGIETIQNEILTNGPVQAVYDVYRDFLSYKSGVFRHVSGPKYGSDAGKITGWGVDTSSKLPYWIVETSWGKNWGMNGFFWVLRGRNEINIESQVWAVDPLVVNV
ncbi:hypothetical protein ABK040_006622 [Willaertia magna]